MKITTKRDGRRETKKNDYLYFDTTISIIIIVGIQTRRKDRVRCVWRRRYDLLIVRPGMIMVLVTVGAPPICRASHPPSAATEKQSSSSTIFQEQKQGLTRVRIKRSSSIHTSTQLASWLRTAAIQKATEPQPEHRTPFP